MIIIFSGYNQRAVIAFLRTLRKNSLDYSIIAAGDSDPILLTDYKEKICHIRKIRPLDLEELLYSVRKVKNTCSRNEPLMIVPSTEALNRFLLANRNQFEEIGCVIPLVSKELYESFSDKESFVTLCNKYRIPVPPFAEPPYRFTGPIVAKPRKYFSSDGNVYAPVFLKNKEECTAFLASHNESDFIFQKYLTGGRSFYLLCYMTGKGESYLFSQENLAQQPAGKSIVFAQTSDIHNDASVYEPYLHMLRNEGFHGLIMIEIRRFDGTDYMIEANPRFWGPSQLFCDSHFNLFECMLKDYGFLDIAPDILHSESSFYYWSGGITGDLSENHDCKWLGNGAEIYKENRESVDAYDIYNRLDTIEVFYQEKLTNLYQQSSKHSGYQVLPDCLGKIVDADARNLVIRSRCENERLSYILKHLDLKGKSIADIGGNTGFFSIEAAINGAARVDYYEGNRTHAEFTETACQVLHLQNIISVHDEYFLFDSCGEKYDICFCLNVLHHFGDDFGKESDIEKAKDRIIDCINSMSKYTDCLVLQLGFNWMGDRNKCLFEHGLKEEMISFVQNGTAAFWDILSIGIPDRKNGFIIYEELNDNNINRNDSLGEFLNRPLIILKSRKPIDQSGLL